MRTERFLIALGAAVLLHAAGMAACSGDGLDGAADDVIASALPDPIVGGPCESAFPGCEMAFEDGVDLGPARDAPVSTFCHKPSHTCRVMQAHCVDGWCFVPAGAYQAGWVDVGPSRVSTSGRPPHRAEVSHPFWIQQTEVTNAHWIAIMDATASPSLFAGCGPECPVADVTVFDVAEFANRLSVSAGLPACYRLEACGEADAETGAGRACDAVYFDDPMCAGYRLPTEVEWELAARAGSSGCWDNGHHNYPYSHCNAAIVEPAVWKRAWFCANSHVGYDNCADLTHLGVDNGHCMGVHPVAGRAPSRLGLYDTAGNASEMIGRVVVPGDGVEVARHAYLFDPGHAAVIRRSDAIRMRGGHYSVTSLGTCTFTRGGARVMAERKWGRSGFRLVRLADETEVP